MKSSTGIYLKALAIAWSGCFIVFMLVYITTLRPLHKSRMQKQAEFTKVRADADLAVLASQEQTKTRLNEHIKELNERLGDFVIEPGSTSNLTYQLSGLSNKIGLNAFQVAPSGQSITTFDQCKYVSGQYYQVGFTTSFNKFARFLNALERYRPAIFVDTFTISRAGQDGTEHKVTMQLAVLVAKNKIAKDAEG